MNDKINEYKLCFFDECRNRHIPVAVYTTNGSQKGSTPFIFSPGYNKHREINAHAFTDYGYICRTFANEGYFVISIQHDIPSDPLLPMSKPYRESRKQEWLKGEENILFIINTFQKIFPEIDWDHLVLAGHSNGGDISVLTATDHPEIVETLLTLDHRRMPLPRTGKCKILSLRGFNYPADPDVIPPLELCQKLGIKIIKMNNISHSDFGSDGSVFSHNYIINTLLRELKMESLVSDM